MLRYLGGDVGRALSVSTTWNSSAEAVFHELADNRGWTRLLGTDESWRDVAREHSLLRWAGAHFHDVECHGRFLPRLEASEELAVELSGCRITIDRDVDEEDERDILVIGRGRPLSLSDGSRQGFRVKMSKGDHDRPIIDACGFAICSSAAPTTAIRAWIWNNNGANYSDSYAQDAEYWCRTCRVDIDPASTLWMNDDDGFIFDECTLDVSCTVIHVNRGLFRRHLTLLEITLNIFYTSVWWGIDRRRVVDTENLLEHGDLVMAPLVRLYQGSSAKLLRDAEVAPGLYDDGNQ